MIFPSNKYSINFVAQDLKFLIKLVFDHTSFLEGKFKSELTILIEKSKLYPNKIDTGLIVGEAFFRNINKMINDWF